MKGFNKFFLIAYLTWFHLKSLRGHQQQCQSNEDCKFMGKCKDNICWCGEDCSNLGVSFLCGKDGKYYKNKCHHLMESCANQREIPVVAAGPHPHCSSHRLHPSAIETDSYPGFKICNSTDYCQNYGICLEKNGLTKFCLCPSEFTGPRCEDRRDDDDLKPIKEKLATFPSKNKENSPIAVAFILFCVLSAMFSSIVTSAICYRYNAIRFEKLWKEERKIKNNKQDILIVQAEVSLV